MKVHQVMVGASPGDAITRIARAMDALLEPRVDARMWAHHIDARCAREFGPVWEMPPGSSEDLVIYHASIGEPLLTEMMLRRPERLVIHYHNITPSRFFEDLDPSFARLLSSGRDEARMLVGRAELVLADSEFNASEMRAITDRPVVVAPPPMDMGDLLDVEPHSPTMHHFAATAAAPMILHVGQLLPHKRPEVLVGAMHVLNTELAVPATLILVGPHRNADYAWMIERYVADLGLANVWIAGERTPEELAAFYRSATVFATASAHEGFCVPVIEAFSFGVPVVAQACGAVPETVGDGGIVLPSDAGPRLMAEALARVIRDTPLREALIAASKVQLDAFSVDRSRRTMLDVLNRVIAR